MAKPILTDADAFEFTSLRGDRLELYGALVGWSDDVQTGVVEHLVVKRHGGIHQRAGAPPRRFDFRCAMTGPDVRARYNRVCDVVLAEPEGQLVHPRFGRVRAVIHSVTASETPADARDTVEFGLKCSETGLKDPPRPAPSALAQAAQAQGAQVAARSAGMPGGVSQAGAAFGERSAGLFAAMQGAEAGLGTLLDVDASISALVAARDVLDALGAPKAVRDQAALALGSALQARNAFAAGRPPLVEHVVRAPCSLGALCQALYGGRGRDFKAEALRLNRIARPHAIPAGTVLLLSDPFAAAEVPS